MFLEESFRVPDNETLMEYAEIVELRSEGRKKYESATKGFLSSEKLSQTIYHVSGFR